MLASHFGMNGSPFQLSPDPDFYFDSHGHHRALAALRRGLSEASGFTVISGEIGAGKTTVVRAVLRELKPAFFVVAQVVSTQLDPEELLRAISIGFGLSSAREGPMALTAGLRRFLADLRAQRRRAVLVVDEAQNLRSDAFDQLVGLAMRGAPDGRGMQICLVGQPELQAMVGTADLLAVREQICVLCHLGPIEREETGPYVEHRLRKVGWNGAAAVATGEEGLKRIYSQACCFRGGVACVTTFGQHWPYLLFEEVCAGRGMQQEQQEYGCGEIQTVVHASAIVSLLSRHYGLANFWTQFVNRRSSLDPLDCRPAACFFSLHS